VTPFFFCSLLTSRPHDPSIGRARSEPYPRSRKNENAPIYAGESFVSRRNNAPITIVMLATMIGYHSPL
jgi:hypothetical protein